MKSGIYSFHTCMLNSLLLVFFSRDGQSRAGVYCAANACIEQVIQHGEVDVFQAVKTVRRHRPQLVENIVSIIDPQQALALKVDHYVWWRCPYVRACVTPLNNRENCENSIYNKGIKRSWK